MDEFWKRGEMAQLAELADMRLSNLSAVLHRSRGVSPAKAKVLACMCMSRLGREVEWHHWVNSKSTLHPAFFGGPVEGEGV